MRAVEPSQAGRVASPDGVRIAYEVFGAGEPTIVFLPSTPIIHSRQWKGQVPYLSRRHRVVTYDGRGNGASDRPVDPAAYTDARLVGDLELVLDTTGTERAVLVGLCTDGVWRAILFAAAHPERVLGIVAFGVGVPLITPPHPHRVAWSQTDPLPTDEGWAKVNIHHWRRDYPDFAQFFFSELLPEPHSTKHLEDAVGWAVEGSVEAMVADALAPSDLDTAQVEATCRAVRCPVLVVKGTDDRCQPVDRAERLADLVGAPLVLVEGAGHLVPAREPVLANLLIRDFIRSLPEGAP
jgi:pimeloyl-ACP methyl ester carboxylesterase